MKQLFIAPHEKYNADLGEDYDELFASLHMADSWKHDPDEIEIICNSQTSIMYLAMMAKRAVAMATMIKPVDSFGNRTALLEDLAVHREFQGQGIGRDLMVFLENQAVELGATRIEFHSRPSRVAAHGLYKSLGFDEVPTTPFRKLLVPPSD